MKKLVKVSVSTEVFEKYKEVKNALSERGRSGYSFASFLDKLAESLNPSTMNSIIDAETPPEYRLKLILENPELKGELLKMADGLLKKRRHGTPAETTSQI